MQPRNLACAWLTILALAMVTCFSEAAMAGQESVQALVPKGLVVEARHVKLSTPVSMMLAGKQVNIDEILEFVVTAKQPIPARALDPVLVVGERLITKYRYIAPNKLIFTEPRPRMLKDGSAVFFQWGHRADARHRLKLSFEFRRAALVRETR